MLRTIRVAVTALVATFVCAPPIIVLGMIGRTNSPRIDQLVRIWARAITRAAGIDLRDIEHPDIDPDTRYVFVANHDSYLDIPVLLAATKQPVRFMAKKSLFVIPIFGWGLKAAGFIPIDRKDPSTAIDSFRLAGQRIRMGNSIVVFPEGGRTEGPGMGIFKKGAFLLAMRGELDIVPVAICGTRDVLPVGELIIRPAPVTIRAGRPIRTSEYSQRTRPELVERTQNEIAQMLDLPHES